MFISAQRVSSVPECFVSVNFSLLRLLPLLLAYRVPLAYRGPAATTLVVQNESGAREATALTWPYRPSEISVVMMRMAFDLIYTCEVDDFRASRFTESGGE